MDLTKKLRDEHQEKSKSNRYKIVNCRRSNLETNDEENVSDKEKSAITIVDIESDVSETTVHKENENKEQKYVYDLYYTSSDYLGDADLEQEHIRYRIFCTFMPCIFIISRNIYLFVFWI